MFVVFCLLLFAVFLPPPEFPPFVKCGSSLADQEEETTEKILPHLNLVFKVKRLRLCDKLSAIETRRRFITVSESFIAAMTVKLQQ